MVDNRKLHKKEKFYIQAKKEGYRARSAYKLLEIQERFNIFKRAFYILDLGSAPGSWLQVAKNYAEENLNKYRDQYYHRDHYKIMGVDIKKVSAIENINIIKADIIAVKNHPINPSPLPSANFPERIAATRGATINPINKIISPISEIVNNPRITSDI